MAAAATADERCGRKHFCFQQKYHTRPQAAADVFTDTSACIFGPVHVVHIYGLVCAAMCGPVLVCERIHKRVCVRSQTRSRKCPCLHISAALPAPFPITLPGELREGREEQLAVTSVPRTSRGPMGQLKLDMCALSASSNSYDCRLTNYELLRWLVESPSRDFAHYRLSGGRRIFKTCQELTSWHVDIMSRA